MSNSIDSSFGYNSSSSSLDSIYINEVISKNENTKKEAFKKIFLAIFCCCN